MLLGDSFLPRILILKRKDSMP